MQGEGRAVSWSDLDESIFFVNIYCCVKVVDIIDKGRIYNNYKRERRGSRANTEYSWSGRTGFSGRERTGKSPRGSHIPINR